MGAAGVAWLGVARIGPAERGKAWQARHGVVWRGEARIGEGRQAMDRRELKAHRKRLGLSLAEAAAQVHVSPRTWARWEAGDRHFPEAIAHLFCLTNRIKYAPPSSSKP